MIMHGEHNGGKKISWGRKALLAAGVFSALFCLTGMLAHGAPVCEERSDGTPFALVGGMETFNEDTYKDDANTTIAGWGDGGIHMECGGADCLLLPVSGASFTGFNSNVKATNWMKSAVGGDFDGDGDDDLVAGGNNSGACGQDGSIAFLPNSAGNGSFPVERVFTCGDGDSVKGLSAADYNGDGFLDVASYDLRGHVRIWFNDGAANFTNPRGIAYTNPAMAWETGIASADVNGDGDIDLFVATDSGNGNVKYLENTGNGTFVEAQSIPVGWGRSNVVGLGDFDQDGDIDFIVGSTFLSRDIKLYLNDGNQNFTFDRVVGSAFQPTFLVVADFDLDGKPDFAVGTDHPGELYYFNNIYDGITVAFTRHGPLEDVTGTPYQLADFDNGGVGDFDGNGYMDIIAADGNDAQNAYVFLNFPTTKYVTDGLATSENVVTLDPTRYAVTRVTLTTVESTPPGTTIAYEITNDGGRTWFSVNAGNGWTVSFPTYGADVRWRATLHTDNDTITPTILSVDIDFSYVPRTEFYRSEIVIDPLDPDEGNAATVYQGSFVIPSNPSEGYLKKYLKSDIKNSTTGPSPRWIADGTGSDTIYSSTDANIGCTLAAGTCPQGNTLSAGQVNGIINLPMGGIDHSAPSIVGAPPYPFWYFYYASFTYNQTERDAFMTFKNNHATRRRVAYVGATDGMLHAIDTITGLELWRYLPRYNKDEIANNLNYPLTDDAKVDASPAVADVKFTDNTWHTVLVCPLGKEKNTVFALDVTNPLNPEVLWEFPGSVTLGGIRSHPSILRMKVDGETRYVALISSGRENDNKAGFSVYALDIQTGTKIWEFNRSDCADATGQFFPGSIPAIDSDYDGYVDRAYVGDFIGRLWELTFDPSADSNDAMGLRDDWTASVLFADSFSNQIYASPALAMDTTGNLVVYFGTAGAANNHFYSIYAEHKTVPGLKGQPKYQFGGGDGYIGDTKIFVSPMLNQGRAQFITSTGSVDTWALCSESDGTSVIHTVSPGGDAVRTETTGKIGGGGQSNNGDSIVSTMGGDISATNPGEVGENGEPPIPGENPPEGSGAPILRLKGWNQVY